MIQHNRFVNLNTGFFFFNKNYGNQLNRNYCGNNPNWDYITIMPLKLNEMLIGSNFLMRPRLWCDNGAVLASPFSFLYAPVWPAIALFRITKSFPFINEKFLPRLLFSGHYNFLKLDFFVSMLFGQFSPDLASP